MQSSGDVQGTRDRSLASVSAPGSPGDEERAALAFSAVLGESHTRSSGLKELNRTIEPIFPERRKVDSKRDAPGVYTSLSKALADDSDVGVLVCGQPSKPLSASEQQKLVDFILDGGHLVVAAAAGGLAGTNMGELLELFGISVNADAVVRAVFHKYMHPKEVQIPDGAVNNAVRDGVAAACREQSGGAALRASCAVCDAKACPRRLLRACCEGAGTLVQMTASLRARAPRAAGTARGWTLYIRTAARSASRPPRCRCSQAARCRTRKAPASWRCPRT